MSKFKNMPGVAWFVIGVCVTALVMPTAAFAAGALKFTGIEGTSGNKADVSPSGQILSAAASPANYYGSADVVVGSSDYVAIASPPSGDALVVTSIDDDVYADPSPGAGQFDTFLIGSSSCSANEGIYDHALNPPTVGNIAVAFNPGLVVPSGDALCGLGGGSVEGEADVIGYTVPAADAPSPTVPHALGPVDQ
jgi:hypothetical protein